SAQRVQDAGRSRFEQRPGPLQPVRRKRRRTVPAQPPVWVFRLRNLPEYDDGHLPGPLRDTSTARLGAVRQYRLAVLHVSRRGRNRNAGQYNLLRDARDCGRSVLQDCERHAGRWVAAEDISWKLRFDMEEQDAAGYRQRTGRETGSATDLDNKPERTDRLAVQRTPGWQCHSERPSQLHHLLGSGNKHFVQRARPRCQPVEPRSDQQRLHWLVRPYVLPEPFQRGARECKWLALE